jgi:hypothetical protein
MLPIPRSAIVAAVSVAAGGALFGFAAGGVVGMDRDLQAAAAPPPPRMQAVEFHRVSDPGECPDRGRSDHEGRV